jgi:hypothetical protein
MNTEMKKHPAFLVSTLLFIGLIFTSGTAVSAGQVLRLQDDSNSRLEVKNAVVHGDETTILFWSWPDRGDPDFRNSCATNYYTVTLRPGLPDLEPRLMAKGACAGRSSLLHGGLLADGTGRFIVEDRLEQWRDGERLSSEPFSSIDHVGSLRVHSSEMGSQYFDWSQSGDMVMAIMVSGYAASDWPEASMVIAALTPDNEKRWLMKLNDQRIMMDRLWAGDDGGALLSISTTDPASMVPDPESRLLVVSAEGEMNYVSLMEVAEPFDFQSMQPGSEEDLQEFFEHQENNRSESIEKLSARARKGGGFDVLFWRESSDDQRNGQFVQHLDKRGNVVSEMALGSSIEDHGLDRWFDFYVEGNQLVLLSNYPVTQRGVNSRRKAWPQTIVSRMDLKTRQIDSRLIPLDRQYLEAAMNAGDEGQQYLEGKPGGTPVLLTSVAGTPLSVSQGWVNKRQTLRIYEATGDLVAFTEGWDKHQAKLAKEEKSRQRKANRQAQAQQRDQDMQATLGMSQDEFDALSEEEQVMLMMQDGNMEAMMASVMKQAQSAQGQSGMTPEQAAQMEASMAQVQQMMQGNSTSMAGAAVQEPSPPEPATNPGASFTVDALMRGRIQYISPGGSAATLSIIDRQDGKELMTRDYPDGKIDEYVSLGRYQIPTEQIGALIKDPNGEILEDLQAKSP